MTPVRLTIAVAVALVLALAGPAFAQGPPNQDVPVTSRVIGTFRPGSDNRVGRLEFVGGLVMTSPSRLFGGHSGFRFLTPGRNFIGVSDTGTWVTGRIARDAAGRPSGVEDFAMQEILDRAGRTGTRKAEIDAESLAVRDGVATIGFERNHRILQFRLKPGAMGRPFGELDPIIPRRELRMNRGFETLAHAPADGPLGGALVVVTERSLDGAGNIFAAVLDGPRKGIFTIRRDTEFDVTDGAFLANGDLLLLERSFSLLGGVRMRLRSIPGGSIARGALVDGEVLLQADMGSEIDNMEAMDVWRREDGAEIVSILSDDNQSMLQRNLYLEFILHPP